jgi:hypothetical protein
MGGLHAWLPGWRVLPLPASGQISNVSAFVLPERMPVADDERQLPMFGDSSDRILRILEEVAHAQRETAHAQRLIAERLDGRPTLDGTIGSLRPTPREQKASRHVPRNPDHRTWRGFVLSMQNLEKLARRQDLRPTKKAICQLGPDDVKTVTRTMTETYGLSANAWPPSTWDPETEPSGQIL